MTDVSGHCLCGQVTWRAPGPVAWTAICHCESCRRATSAPFVPWLGVADRGLDWAGPVAVHRTSAGVDRGFCDRCGTPLFYRNPVRWPGETHICALTRDDPAAFVPELHVYYDERLAWVEMRDGVPKCLGAPDDGTAPVDDATAHD